MPEPFFSEANPLQLIFDPEAEYQALPGGTGARLADTSSPIERAANIRAAEDAERARRRLEARNRSQVAADQMAVELEQDPIFSALSSGLDTASFGLDDEIVGALMSASGPSGLGIIDEDIDYRDAQRALDESSAYAQERNPNAARLGAVGGILATAPLAEFAAPAAGATGAARVIPALRMGGVGAGLGGAAGYLGAEDGDRLASTLRGAATGGAFGLGGGGLMALGRGIRAPQTLATAIGGGAVEGAGYGLAATPGASREPVTDTSALLREAPGHVATGAGFGAGFGSLGGVFSRPRLALARSQQARANAPVIPEAPSTNVLDDAALDLGIPDSESALATAGSEMTPAEAAQAARDSLARRPLGERVFSETLAADPATKRWNSMGVTDRRGIRSVMRSFGSVDAGLAALREAGLAPEGAVYATPTERAAALAANERASRILGDVHSQIEGSGATVPGGPIADDIERAAEAMRTGVESDRTARVMGVLQNRADDFRYGRGVRPTTAPGRFELIDETIPGLEGDLTPSEMIDVTEIPPEIDIPYSDLRTAMGQTSDEARSVFSGATVDPTPEQLAAVEIYRAQMGGRNRAIDEAGLRETYDPANRIFRATQIVRDAPYEMSNPADLRGAVGGSASARGAFDIVGRLAGQLRERAIGQYAPSVFAAVNEAAPTSSRLVGALRAGLQLDPGSAERFAANADRAASEATRGATVEAAGDPGQAIDLELHAADAGEVPVDAAEFTRQRDAEFGRRLGIEAPDASVPDNEPPPTEADDYTRQRDRAFGERLMRGRSATP